MIHQLLGAFHAAPDSMREYFLLILTGVPLAYAFFFTPILVKAMPRDTNRWKVHAGSLALMIMVPVFFVTSYPTLTEKVEEITTANSAGVTKSLYFRIKTVFPNRNILLYNYFLDHTGSDPVGHEWTYLGVMPLVLSPLDSTFSIWVAFEQKHLEKNIPEDEVEKAGQEFLERCRKKISEYNFDSVTYYSRNEPVLVELELIQKSGLGFDPVTIIKPFRKSPIDKVMGEVRTAMFFYVLFTLIIFFLVYTSEPSFQSAL